MRQSVLCLLAVILILGFHSCSSSKETYRIYHTFNDKVSQFYVVDTINFTDPVLFGIYNLTFITEKDSIINKKKFSINNEDVFLFHDTPFWDFTQEYFDNGYWRHFVNECVYYWYWDKKSGLGIFRKKPKFFIVALMNARYFTEKHEYILDLGYQDNCYVRVVYPVCEDDSI